MATYATEGITACCRLKTTRQKRRALLEHRDKTLLQLGKRYNRLYAEKRNLPLVPLAEPYQRGWKRTFVLRPDVARSADAAFFGTLLEKINTVMYHRDEQFVKECRRKQHGKRLKEPIPQDLLFFFSWEWDGPECKLTEKERLFFVPVIKWLPRWQKYAVHYQFAEPWRYVLQVSAHIVTHAKAIDSELDSELQRIDNYLTDRKLHPVLRRLESGRSDKRYYAYRSAPTIPNPFKNKPLHQILGEANDDNT